MVYLLISACYSRIFLERTFLYLMAHDDEAVYVHDPYSIGGDDWVVSVLSTITSTGSLCSLESLVHSYRLTARGMCKVLQSCIAYTQQQLGQESGCDDVVPVAFPRATRAEPRLGRSVRIASPESVQRQDLLRDHRDCGQGHAQACHEADKVLLWRRGGLAVRAAGARTRRAAGRGSGRRLCLDRFARLVVQHECEIDRRDGDHVRRIKETEL